ncbi:hypothetical protein HN51_045922 [Arachis hypogaea]
MGYNFVFTDVDIMWFRDPFPQFHHDADFQIACDHFHGSIEFYKFWYSLQEVYPGYHDQDVLNFIKVDPFIIDIELEMRFLDTALLLQHGIDGDGDGFGEVEDKRVHKEDREVDGGLEERTDLRARVLAAVPSGVRGTRGPIEHRWNQHELGGHPPLALFLFIIIFFSPFTKG